MYRFFYLLFRLSIECRINKIRLHRMTDSSANALKLNTLNHILSYATGNRLLELHPSLTTSFHQEQNKTVSPALMVGDQEYSKNQS